MCEPCVGTHSLTYAVRCAAVLHVLLHELCHNQFGPHSASFYGLLDDITVECEALMAKKQGGTGAGFDAHGEKLGHRGGWGAQPGDPRAAAREAALKRAKQQGVMGGGGRRVGGGFSEGAAAGLTPQQAAAAAAQRRLAAQQFSRDAGLEDDVQEEGGKAVEPLQLPPAQVLPRLRLGGPCICGACDGKPGACPRGPLALRGGADAPIELLNSDSDEREGGAAEAGRPKRPALAPSRRRPCAACASARGCACWSCGACTRRNTGGSSHCDSCATWRYSRDGPPAP